MDIAAEGTAKPNSISAAFLLADFYESCGDYEKAQKYVWHQIELEPWQEEAHQQLMRLLVLSGRRSEAMNRYEICRNILLDGLGVEPSKDTRLLYEKNSG